MLTDILTILWKEGNELLTQSSRFNPNLLLRLFGLLFISYIPISQAGADWFTAPLVMILSLMIPLMTVAEFASDTFAGEKERHTLTTLLASRLSDLALLIGKALSITFYGWIHVVLILIFGMIIGNITSTAPGIIIYSPGILAGSLLIGLLISSAASLGGVILSMQATTVKAAQQNLGSAYVILSLSIIVAVKALGVNLWSIPANLSIWSLNLITASTLLLINGILFWIARRLFRREKLILS